VRRIVGLSFVSRAHEVQQVNAYLDEHGRPDIGMILKIEKRRAFEHLPGMLLAALGGERPSGVMIARGDLAVECGYERLAEVQEEILWLCQAAHVPVIWATQVLDQLAKTGRPSRAEITDAAMGVHAECVMLNKGPQIVQAISEFGEGPVVGCVVSRANCSASCAIGIPVLRSARCTLLHACWVKAVASSPSGP